MNNKPVAWILGGHLDSAKKMIHLCRVAPTQVDEGYVPLYTHPVELTDEEILEAWQEAKHTALNTKGNFVEVLFARAILKKASEK